MSSNPLDDLAHIRKQVGEAARMIQPTIDLQKQMANMGDLHKHIAEAQKNNKLLEQFANSPAARAMRDLNAVSAQVSGMGRVLGEMQAMGVLPSGGTPSSQTVAKTEKHNDPPVIETGPGRYLKTAPEQFRLARDDARDLAFVGWKLGSGFIASGRFDPTIGTNGGEYERETEVTIYVTKAGDYVVHESRTRNFGDPAGDKVMVIHQKGDFPGASGRPAEERLLASLHMGSATRDAWNEACEKYPPLRPFEVETLD